MIRAILAALIFAAELVAIALVYQVMVDFDCFQTDYYRTCRGLRSGVTRGGVMLVVLVIYGLIRTERFVQLVRSIQSQRGSHLGLAVNGLGLLVVFSPLLLIPQDALAQNFLLLLALLVIGGILMAIGALVWIMPARDWRAFLFGEGWLLPGILIGAFFLPDLAVPATYVWNLAAMNHATFYAVFVGLQALGVETFARPEDFLIVAHDFPVTIARQCSGVEGLALTTGFMVIYALLMRGELINRRYWGVLFPVALLISWVLNIVRIIGLLLIGAYVSPQHAINGFHSYGGWLMFTFLAISIVIVANSVAWFHKTPANTAKAPPVSRDPLAFQILPMVVLLVSGILVNTFWSNPTAGYPLQAGLMLLVLLYFRDQIIALNWSFDWLAVLSGLAVGVMWVLPVWADASPNEPMSLFWVLCRLLGTMLLVPIIEEVFFRGYLLEKLGTGGIAMRLLALVVTSVMFGLLHERIWAGFAAGLIFGLIKLRRDRICDPVQSHVTANVVVAAVAITLGDWSLI